MEYSGYFFGMRRSHPLPSYDGFIIIELSERPVRYHIQPLFVGAATPQECHTMAMAACRIACLAADAIRGRYNVERFARSMTRPCMERLQVMQELLDTHMLSHPDMKARFCYLPTVPTFIEGMLISNDTIEMTVLMTIGSEPLRVNLKFRYVGSRWMCSFADLG
ncbi:hypothetical protein [Bifidobacterium oedipodis]|uniref:Uncharacterized protein n=1 Tax=Bifidobacterium oedipodis TaxID=2675322 RepID=A0A7Y0EPZ4_9BIFI|nr:hypothetical protein [Bifidobacterium sp. DSM 109957]NMM94313.1 hypothetical protein [Bifidobacterium sp. DSM 109957]